VQANFLKQFFLCALALQALCQSFGWSDGSWGFGNVLANALAYRKISYIFFFKIFFLKMFVYLLSICVRTN